MKNSLKNRIYADGEVNQDRQIELDLARAVVVICLALVHCTIECTPESGLVSGIPYLFDSIIGGPLSAPLLMFVMGVGIVYARRGKPKHFFLRGLRLVFANYLLNICRFLIPFLIGHEMTGDHERFISPLLYLVLENDVLMFAGLALMIMSLLLYYRVPDGMMLAGSFGLSLIATLIEGIDVGSPLGNILLGYLIGTEDAAGMVCSYFPVAHWLVVVVCGFWFGKRLRRMQDKALFYRIVSPVCLVITVVYFAVGIHNELGMFGEGQLCYYHLSTPDMMASICAVFAVLGPYDWLARRLPQKVLDLALEISRNINAVYCIHWVILSMIVNVVIYPQRGTPELPVGTMLLLGLCISITSIWLAHFWSQRKRKS